MLAADRSGGPSRYWLMCRTLAGGKPLNQVDDAALYAPIFSLYNKSPMSSSGSSSASEIVSKASQVGPKTAQICVGPLLKERTGYLQWSKMMPEKVW